MLRGERPGENKFAELYGHRYLVPAETEVISRQPGGGGWGDPLERDPAAVLRDVRNEFVSLESAQREYGVVIALPEWRVDAPATDALRTRMRAVRAWREPPSVLWEPVVIPGVAA